jgi:NTE family protein
MPEKLKADAVFEGGGVKGIGLVGAIAEIEKAGYEFVNLAGTSAGAIAAGLLAVGYKAAEIKTKLEELDYCNFMDKGFMDRFGIAGKAMSLAFEFGIYEGKYFHDWFEGLLKAKGKTKFGDLVTEWPDDEKYRYTLQVIAADLTDQRMLVLPRDLKSFGLDPEVFPIARAVRMSMSIPLFFEPVKLEDKDGRVHIIVDGGLLSNYPIWLLDDGTANPPWPTFGFKLVEPAERNLGTADWKPIDGLLDYLKAMLGTLTSAHDRFHVSNSKGDYQRTIGIPTTVTVGGQEKEIKSTDFDLTKEESRLLYENGVTAGRKFLDTWNFEAWKTKYRPTRN